VFLKDTQYKEHKYVSQNRTQELLDHMYPVPCQFEVDPKYLYGIAEEAFNDGFHCLWNVVRRLYESIIANPESFGLPLYEDYIRTASDSKWNDSANSTRRLMDFLGALCATGEIKNNGLFVSVAAYKAHIKNNRLKITNAAAAQLMSRLADFGFTFSNFSGSPFDKGVTDFQVSYEANINLIPALKGYCSTASNSKEFYCCQYHFVTKSDLAVKPTRAFAFSQYLDKEQREFFVRLHERMLEEGFVCKDDATFGTVFGVEYCTERQLKYKSKPWLIRCRSDHNQLDITLTMYNIAAYDAYLDSLPKRVKAGYKAARPWQRCASCESPTCSHRHIFFLDSKEHAVNLYGGYGAKVKTFNVDDVDLYVSLIKKEAAQNY